MILVRDLCEDFVIGASVIKVAQEIENVLGDTFIYNVYLSDYEEAYVFEYIILFMR